MLREKLKNHKVILASGSPRRQTFLEELDLDYVIEIKKIEETYPLNLKRSEITDYISKAKAAAFQNIKENEILITSDTIVWLEEKALGKPEDVEEATYMLRQLSGRMHEVITSVCFTTKKTQIIVNDTTKVWFKSLTEEEISHYIKTYKPYDKAGSYGIQEWIGFIGIERIEGCYFNVMGLPVRLVYKTLNAIADH